MVVACGDSAADRSVVGRISQAFSTRLFMKMDSRVLLCRLIFVTSREEVVLPKNDPEVVKNAFSWRIHNSV